MAAMKQTINGSARWAPLVMSAAAMALLAFAFATGWGKGPPGDEGPAAHLWQLLIGLQVPLILVFAATAEWRRPLGPLAILGVQVLALLLAMAPVAILRL